jgi:hypothetical protein
VYDFSNPDVDDRNEVLRKGQGLLWRLEAVALPKDEHKDSRVPNNEQSKILVIFSRQAGTSRRSRLPNHLRRFGGAQCL